MTINDEPFPASSESLLAVFVAFLFCRRRGMEFEIVLARLEASGGITKRANACYGVPVARARARAGRVYTSTFVVSTHTIAGQIQT